MAFNVQYSFNNGLANGTATSITALRQAIYNYAHSGSVSDSTGSDYSHLTQCTLSGTAEGQLTTGNEQGTTTGTSKGLFNSCSALTNLDLSSFDTRNVTDMSRMCSGCTALTSINLSSFDTRNVTDMSQMFQQCSKLTNLDLSSFDTRNVTNMVNMFQLCSKLTNLDLSSFDTSNITSLSYIFSSCSALTNLDLSSFDTRNVTNMNQVFNACTALTSIKVNKLSWNTSKVTSSSRMFYNCTSLPNFDSNIIDVTKAIDKSLGGYLDVIYKPLKYYKYYEHYSDGERVIPKSTDMFDFVTQEDYDSITSPDPDMLYFIIE